MKNYFSINSKSYLALIISVIIAMGVNVPANASEAMLKRFFAEVSTMQADFDQSIVDEQGSVIEQKKGIFSLSRPGKFRWNYINDDPDYPLGQQIISNGSLITFYEPDLDTASQRSMINAVEHVPTLVLVQSGASLERHFMMSNIGETDGRTWVNLKPKGEDTSYRSLMVGFLKTKLSAIILTDGLGNETRLTFKNVKINKALQSGLFAFTPGPEVDVVRQ